MEDTVEIDLERMVHGGAAMGRASGRTIFVPHGLPGERVRARITDDKGRYAYAALEEVIRPSPARVEPRCNHAGPWGGGPDEWQHIAYDQQVTYKREIVTDQLQRVGKFENPVVHSVIAAPQPWEYRRHITFAVSREGELGFWSSVHRAVVPVERCYLMHPALQELYDELNFNAQETGIARVRFQMGVEPYDRMIVLELREDIEPEIEVDIPVSVNLLLADNEPVNLIGSAQVTYQIADRGFRATAGSFFYPNMEMAGVLAGEVLDKLALQGEESVLELHSGVGMLTAFIAPRADMVLSVESYPPAVSDADLNLEDLDNVELVEGSAEEVLNDLVGPFDAVVVDPPPAGLSADVVDALARLDPSRIVYSAADPATLARDAQRLTKHGFRLVDVQPLDMEPQTPHVVSVALLTK